MTDEQLFDVIVVGAGPAGSIAAKKSAEQGLRTILIEKRKVPRPKLCAGAVSIKAINLIDEEIPAYLNEGYIRGFRFFSPSLRSTEMVSNEPLAISVSRDRFDAFLVDLAISKGCIFVDSAAVVDVSVLNDRVVCRIANGRLINGKMVVGADGVAGIVAKKTGIRRKWEREQIGLCLETRISLSKRDLEKIGDVYELYLIDIPLGYGWVLPKRSSISLGIGGCLAYIHRPQELLAGLCRTVSELKRFDLKLLKFDAHLIPAGGFERRLTSERVILAGDAAGFVDPLSGEGIYYAMKSGFLAAKACREAIEQQNVSSSFLEEHYSRVCKREFGNDLRIALNLTYRIHDNYDLFFDVLESTSDSLWIRLARGETDYGALRRKLLPNMLKKLIRQKIRNLSIGRATRK